MDEFLSIDNENSGVVHVDPVPVQANAPTQDIMPAQADMPIQVDVPPQANVPPQGDYEAIAKSTRSTSAHGSTQPTKKPRRYLMIELATKLPSPQ